MRLVRFLPLLALGWAQACAIYNEGLLDGDDDEVEASGGKASSGGKTGSGGAASGGRTSGGAASGGRATGGDKSGGAANAGGEGGETGGTSSGGSAPGGNGSGGEAEPSGGAASGGAGTGGTPPMGPFLVTDMSKSTHSNSPFFGKIDRFGEPDIVWATDGISEMLVPKENDSSDLVLHVEATFPKLGGWGLDIAITLKSGQAFDLTSYKTLTFDLVGVDQDTPLRIGLEDYASHRSTSSGAPCSSTGVGEDCDKHVEALATFVPDSDWETITLDLDTTTFEGCGLGCERENALDLTRIYAIHFKMDPDDEVAADFSLDNIYIDN